MTIETLLSTANFYKFNCFLKILVALKTLEQQHILCRCIDGLEISSFINLIK